MPTIKDLRGQKFGRLTVIEFAGLNKDKKSLWKCQCECEKKTIKIYMGHSLKIGHAKGCGCIKQPGPIEADQIIREKLLGHSTRKGDCLEWQKYIPENGYHYGMLYYHKTKKYHAVHRLSYMVFKGDIPSGMCVLHSCDNRFCIEPKHLRIGTKKDNNQDMLKRKRGNPLKGKFHHKAKLSEEDIIKIRDLRSKGIILKEIAKTFNVHLATIAYICNGTIWRHV